MTDFGLNLDTLSQIDNAVTVSAGSNTAGSSFDLGDPSSVVNPPALNACFSLTQSATNDAGDLEIRIEWSDDDFSSDVPTAGETPVIFTWVAGSAGDDLGLSGRIPIVPKARYGRFRFYNNNGTDSFDMDSYVAENLLTDGT